MIFGIGIDIIEPERVERQLVKTSGLMENIFTQNEIDYCNSKSNPYQYFAARFSAKEAFFKALGTGMRHGMSFSEVEVLNDESGKPNITLHGNAKNEFEKRNLSATHLSISHIKSLSNAVVVICK